MSIDNYVGRLKPRESFYGGRTEPTKLLYDFKKNNEKRRYIDFVSLYPTVNYYDEYPIDHPTKILQPKKYDPSWFGLIKCKVYTPRGLYFPVLPFKQECKGAHKLLFSLCRACAKKIDKKCRHFQEIKERELR